MAFRRAREESVVQGGDTCTSVGGFGRRKAGVQVLDSIASGVGTSCVLLVTSLCHP